MNLFVVFRQGDGTLELVTPPLDGMILPGVTRDSVLSLARGNAAGTLRIPNLTTKLVVSERGVTMKEVSEAAQSGRLVEMFGSGESTVFLPFHASVRVAEAHSTRSRHGCYCQPRQ
jgi:branched-chain amino acid aminotransferase